MTKETMQHWTREDLLDVLKEVQVSYLQPEIRRIVQEELQAERSAFWVPAERHYNEHQQLEKCVKDAEEKEANHEFVSTVRIGMGYAGKISFGIAISALVVFIGGAIWMAIVAAVKAAKGGG